VGFGYNFCPCANP